MFHTFDSATGATPALLTFLPYRNKKETLNNQLSLITTNSNKALVPNSGSAVDSTH